MSGSLMGLGRVHRDQGRYPESIALFRRALAINERALGPEHPNVAVALKNIALCQIRMGQHPQAMASAASSADRWDQ